MISPFGETELFSHLKTVSKPIFIYGMGNGAEKLKYLLDKNRIPLSGVFASDEFVRGHSFLGFRVIKYSELPADAVILLAFGSFLPDVLARFDAMASEHEFYAPDLPLFGDDYFDETVLQARKGELSSARALLCDNQSRLVFDNTVRYKISGKISWLRECESDKSEIYTKLLRVCENERCLDLGAYDGDTVRELLGFTGGSCSRIIALEPDCKNFKKLVLKTPQAECRELGAYSFCGELAFSTEASRNSSISKSGKRTVKVDTIDNICRDFAVTYIKMDVEGSEREALLGAKQTLKEKKPRLLISAYHRMWDFFELVNLIHELNPEYRIYMRHQPYVPNWETNIIAL